MGTATFSFTFNTPGDFSYVCGVHSSMTGTIRVSSAGGTVSLNWQLGITGRTTTINRGDTVTWTWTDTLTHTVTATGSPPLFDSGTRSGTGTSFSFTFNTVGDFSYFCSVHPTQMTGTISVRDPTQVTPSGTGTFTQAASKSNTPRAGATGSSTFTRAAATASKSNTPSTRPATPSTSPSFPRATSVVLPWNTGIRGRTNYVYRGTTVYWNWTDTAQHNVYSLSSPAAWPDSQLSTGVGIHFSRTFNTVGSYSYGCRVHSFMAGKIVVVNRQDCSTVRNIFNCKRFPGQTTVGSATLDIHQCRWKFNFNSCKNKNTGWQQGRLQ
jgi:plastocyanin